MIHCQISYFLRKLIFSEATIRWDVLFLFEVIFIRPADSAAGYEFGNPKQYCTLLYLQVPSYMRIDKPCNIYGGVH